MSSLLYIINSQKTRKNLKHIASGLWCPDSELNQGHADFQSAALPTELSGLNECDINTNLNVCKV